MTQQKKVFIDCETTGLEFHHDIWEIAWAVDDGPIESRMVPHSLRNADPKALELNGYWTRIEEGYVNERADLTLRTILEGATIVAANPAFDATRLQLRWGCAPWHYRMIDVSAMSIPVLGLREDGKPKGLFDIAKELREDFGMGTPEPDHTAAKDVEVLRSVYHGLMGTIERVPF